MHASWIHTEHYRDPVLVPALSLISQAMLAGWATRGSMAHRHTLRASHHVAAPSKADRVAATPTAAAPAQPQPLRAQTWMQGNSDALGDHILACSRTGLLARRAKVVERAWVRVAREAVGAEGHVVPQQWLTYTTAPGVPASDRRRLDLMVYGATAHGGALCCDATLVSPLTRTGHPQPCTAEVDGAALQVAERKRVAYPELSRGGPQKNCSCSVARSAAGGVQGRSASSATMAPPWILFSTLPRPRGPAVSPCGPKPGPRVAAGELSSSSGFRGLGTLLCRHKRPLEKKN